MTESSEYESYVADEAHGIPFLNLGERQILDSHSIVRLLALRTE